MITFCETRPVSYVLGGHIEMSRQPGVDYPIRTTYQPDEPPLQMTVDQLQDVRLAIDSIGDRPGRHAFADFVICRSEDDGAAVRTAPTAPPGPP